MHHNIIIGLRLKWWRMHERGQVTDESTNLVLNSLVPHTISLTASRNIKFIQILVLNYIIVINSKNVTKTTAENCPEKKKSLTKVVIFVFFAHKKCSLSFMTTDVTWNILKMSLSSPFWALNVSVTLLSMQGQKRSCFIKNILICVPKMNKGLTGLKRHEGE